jgi:hypothetical protein
VIEELIVKSIILELDGVEVINPRANEELDNRTAYGDEFFQVAHASRA